MSLQAGEVSILFTQLSECTDLRGRFPPALFGRQHKGTGNFSSTLLTHKPVPFVERRCPNQQLAEASTQKSPRKQDEMLTRGVPLIHPAAQGHSSGSRALLKAVLKKKRAQKKKTHNDLAQPFNYDYVAYLVVIPNIFNSRRLE